MLLKVSKQKLGFLQKAKLSNSLLLGENTSHYTKGLSAVEMQQLRDYFEQQILYYSSKQDRKKLVIQDLKEAIGPVPNYYHKQDCREPIEACLNETCIASYPPCFSRKMEGQINALAKILRPYIAKND
ncbi:MAG: hypothetical protein ACRBF0_10755 [Calditrichia bacterium]